MPPDALNAAPAAPVPDPGDRMAPGDRAPDFALPGADGEMVRLTDFRGRPLVLFFYPKAETTACTAEAVDFTRLAPAFAEAGVAVLGVSRDPVRAIARFRDKHALTVTLATDEDGAMLAAYGVWVEKSMYGRRFYGIERATFLIDAQCRIARAWRKVKVKGHAEEVLAAARAL